MPFREGLIRWSNPLCRRGGYEVDESVSEMVREKSTEKVFASNWPGDEGSGSYGDENRPGFRCRHAERIGQNIARSSAEPSGPFKAAQPIIGVKGQLLP